MSVLLDGSSQDIPEPGVSRGPFELVLLVQMDCEVVAPGEALTTHMALVARYKIPLIMEEKHHRKMLLYKTSLNERVQFKNVRIPPFTSCSFL